MKFIITFWLLLLYAEGKAQLCIECHSRKTLNFNLLKKEGLRIDTTAIRTDGVYVMNIKDSTKHTVSYFFYRFFKNGRVYMSCEYCSYPTDVEFNDLRYGHYGQYRVESANKLKIEAHELPLGYQYQFFDINGDWITYQFYMSRNSKDIQSMPPFSYHFKKVPLDSKSFW